MIFTVAIPTYNNASVVRSALESCINQDFDQEYEILVANNHCTDHTQDILDEYAGKIRVVINPKTVTPAENHNICLEEAKGDYLIYCHSDDKLLPDALTKFYHILKNRGFPKKYVLWGRSMFRDYYSSWQNTGVPLGQVSSGLDCLKAFFTGGLPPSGTCYSRKSFSEAGGFIYTEHRLAPIDMTVLWRLVLKHFEFEMSGNIFFIREYASTVLQVENDEWMDSAVEAITRLLDTLSENEKKSLIGFLGTSRTHSFNTYIAFKKIGLLPKSFLLKNWAIALADHPSNIFRSRNWKVLGKIIRS